jgi:hypothetical protein
LSLCQLLLKQSVALPKAAEELFIWHSRPVPRKGSSTINIYQHLSTFIPIDAVKIPFKMMMMSQCRILSILSSKPWKHLEAHASEVLGKSFHLDMKNRYQICRFGIFHVGFKRHGAAQKDLLVQ